MARDEFPSERTIIVKRHRGQWSGMRSGIHHSGSSGEYALIPFHCLRQEKDASDFANHPVPWQARRISLGVTTRMSSISDV